MTPQVDQFIRDFKSCAYWCKHLIWLNEQLDVLEHELTWGRHSSIELTEEQLKSPLPMPTNTSRRLDAIDWQVWEDKEKVLAEIDRCRQRILECRKVELLSITEQNLLADRYWFGMSAYDVADKYGYSKPGLYKHINSKLNWLLNAEKFFTLNAKE